MQKRMDWRRVMFDWNRARALLLTIEEGSLSAAARASGVGQPTLGRQVEALEAELGVVLFERDGRGLRPTPTALDLVEPLRQMAEAAGQVSRLASGHAQATDGVVRISASDSYAAFLLPPAIVALRAAHPGIQVEVVATSAISDLRRREADIAVRNTRPEDPSLVARKLRDAVGRLYATPGLLDRLGRPTSPAGFAEAPIVSFEDTAAMARHMVAAGFPVSEANFVVSCQSHLVQWEMVRRGLGLGWMDERIGDAEPGVERALADGAAIPFPVWLVAHREVARSRRLRIVFDALAAALM